MTRIIGHGKRKRRYTARGLPDRFVAWIEYDRDPDTGERRRISKEFARAGDRDAWLVEQLGEANQAELLARHQRRARLTVGDLLDRYVEHNGGAKPWSPSHAARTAGICKRDLAPLRPLEAMRLTPSRVERYFQERGQAGAAPNTLRLARAALSRAYRLAYRDRLIPAGYNPGALAELQVKRLPPRYLKPEDARTFLARSQDHEHALVYATALVLALRPGEVVGLHWDDLDWEAGTLHIRRNVQLVGGKYHVLAPKADSERVIAVPAVLLERLRAYRRTLDDRKVTSVVMFPAARSRGYLNQPMLNRRLGALLEQLGLERVPMYGLRHTGATLMREIGIDTAAIQAVMGHSTIGVTLRYAHATSPVLAGVAQQVGEFLASDRPTGGTTGGSERRISRKPSAKTAP